MRVYRFPTRNTSGPQIVPSACAQESDSAGGRVVDNFRTMAESKEALPLLSRVEEPVTHYAAR